MFCQRCFIWTCYLMPLTKTSSPQPLTFTTLWADAADDKLRTYFLMFFLRKQASTFHANCLLRRQCAWNVEASLFSWKPRKIFQNVVCWIFFPSTLIVKNICKMWIDIWDMSCCHAKRHACAVQLYRSGRNQGKRKFWRIKSAKRSPLHPCKPTQTPSQKCRSRWDGS